MNQDSAYPAVASFEFFQRRVAEVARRPSSHITADSDLLKDLGCDSLQLVELVAVVNELGGDMLDEDIGWDDATVGDLYQLYCVSVVGVQEPGG